MTTITGSEGDDFLIAPPSEPTYELDLSFIADYVDSNGTTRQFQSLFGAEYWDINSTATEIAMVHLGGFTQLPQDTNQGTDIITFGPNGTNVAIQSTRDDGSQPGTFYGTIAPQFSPSDTYVAFLSDSAFLDGTDTNARDDLFVKNLATGDIERVSVSESGVQSDGHTRRADWISETRLVIQTDATNLIDGQTLSGGLFIKDIATGEVQELKLSTGENLAEVINLVSGGLQYKISSDGEYLIFSSDDALHSGARDNGLSDVYRWKLATTSDAGAQAEAVAANLFLSAISTDSDGGLSSSTFAEDGARYGDVTSDGLFAAFLSDAGDLVENDSNSTDDVFLKDLTTGVVTRISVNGEGGEINQTTQVTAPKFSPDGSMLFFSVINQLPNSGGLTTGTYVYYIEEAELDQLELEVSGETISPATLLKNSDGFEWLADSSGLFYHVENFPMLISIDPNGGSQTVFLEGLGGNDTLQGGEFNDTLDGGADNDILRGLAGDDLLIGGSGADTADYSQDNANGATEGALIELFRGQATDGFGNTDTFQSVEHAIGSQLGDRIDGYSAANRLDGQSGDDIINGYAGNDTLIGGGGDDTITGGRGNDLLQGGEGNDSLNGNADDDILEGGAGDDYLLGDLGLDQIRGGDGNDYIRGGDGNDFVDAGAGNDSVRGDGGNDRLFGLDGDDYMLGGDGDDYIVGNAGDDLLVGGTGDDILQGREGNDRLFGEDGIDFLFGFEGADELHGGAGDDFLAGYAGNDLIYGGDGNDRFYGMENDDTLHGGNGDDFLIGNEGNDTVYGDAGNDNLRGRDGNDELFGGEGNDYMIGGAGSDTMSGDGGFDTLVGESGTDTFVFSGNWKRDTVADWSEEDVIDLTALELQGTGETTADAFAKLTLVQDGTTAIISVTGDTRNDIRLANTDISTIDMGDFRFTESLRGRRSEDMVEEENDMIDFARADDGSQTTPSASAPLTVSDFGFSTEFLSLDVSPMMQDAMGRESSITDASDPWQLDAELFTEFYDAVI